MNEQTEAKLTRKDFQTDQDVRWCPGCGDYAILAALQKTLPELGVPKEQIAVVSGIGCSSRLPYYVGTYGFHTIHGRAFCIATGLKAAQPHLSVWVATGDGDALSIGGNHLIHAIRRNVDINILLFNNRIYGLTKGQYSPTSELGKRTKSTPDGSIDRPFEPLQLALGAGATFVARTVDKDPKHMSDMMLRAAQHRGTSIVEIYQNCNIFNDGAFAGITDRATREDEKVDLVHGEPMVFGKDRDRGIRVQGLIPEVVEVGPDGVSEEDLLHHDENSTGAHLAYLLSQLEPPDFPTPMGVFRALEEETYDDAIHSQLRDARAAAPEADLDALLQEGDTWRVNDAETTEGTV